MKDALDLMPLVIAFVLGSAAMRLYVAFDVPQQWEGQSQQEVSLAQAVSKGGPLSVLSVAHAMQYRLDQFVLGARWPAADFGVYSAGSRLLDVAFLVSVSITQFWIIHLQRSSRPGAFRTAIVSTICGIGGAGIFALLLGVVLLLGREFNPLIEHAGFFILYAGMMGLVNGLLSTAVASDARGSPSRRS
jgi:O-antigen/teichoic acid export membrane protein